MTTVVIEPATDRNFSAQNAIQVSTRVSRLRCERVLIIPKVFPPGSNEFYVRIDPPRAEDWPVGGAGSWEIVKGLCTAHLKALELLGVSE